MNLLKPLLGCILAISAGVFLLFIFQPQPKITVQIEPCETVWIHGKEYTFCKKIPDICELYVGIPSTLLKPEFAYLGIPEKCLEGTGND